MWYRGIFYKKKKNLISFCVPYSIDSYPPNLQKSVFAIILFSGRTIHVYIRLICDEMSISNRLRNVLVVRSLPVIFFYP